ncbi:protein of unknown function [Taphrina deformans PYCC 5710]|uniref:Uncharacterized protein n=1 Tax=Taphrina deformans (strain PYCC 5710 / ATCC 11124 / CBS 356.35 / IMI 108563 / JCM 9778 / NBRC 8474) TaxID=1097556 RepID=R4XAH9_TAPDE|nr:protein of unknown function [Taphrina deformans PYCC 5710]|eukprot:CCG82512.1 protein of unknown function [Taphrina deformans PYCC 5710]
MNNYAPSSKAQFKKSARPMCHTDRGYKLATSLAQHRNRRNLKVLQNRGGSEEFERIMDIMDRRQQDLLLAREAKRHAASQLSMADEEFDDENCCAILPVQHAQQIERDRLQELLERQREIDAMEAEIEEYSRLAEEEEAKMDRDAQAVLSMRQEQNQVMQSEIREPWDISDEDVEMSG